MTDNALERPQKPFIQEKVTAPLPGVKTELAVTGG